MQAHYTDHAGRTIGIGSLIGKGGEGAVYEVVGNQQLVAKIYHQAPSPQKVAKLTAMVHLADPGISKCAAWPVATLQADSVTRVVGILLPRLDHAKEIYKLYSPAERAVVFPSASWKFLIRAARNTAIAFETLHQRTIVIGDVNQGNLFVSDRATVSLIDCDSFQIRQPRGAFLCEVGVPHFTPPELQSANFAQTPRTANHDNFGLAILIFHLLFMGRHPFAGRYSGSGDMPIERAISEHRFAFGSEAARLQMAPPPNSLTLKNLPRNVGTLFERAFNKGGEDPNSRPSAAEWAEALGQLEAALTDCQQDPGHSYPKIQSTCPWCLIVGGGGPNFFLSVTIRMVSAKVGQLDVSAVWREVQSIQRPNSVATAPATKPREDVVPRPLPEECFESATFANIVGCAALVGVTLVCAAIAIPAAALFGAPIALVFGVWWSIIYFTSPLGRERTSRRAALLRARMSFWKTDRLFQEAAQRNDAAFMAALGKLQQFKDAWGRLDAEMYSEKESLTKTAEDRQRAAFLRGQIITAGAIEGFGDARVAMLRFYGIETALDINPSAIRAIPGIGEALSIRLEVWRAFWEHKFRFDASKGVPQADLNAIAVKYFQKRFDLYRRMQIGLGELKGISTKADDQLKKFADRRAMSERIVNQAASDLRVATRSRLLEQSKRP
jgi:DNA-binding helix-hairpin-helix protein with protein kinase domain